MSEKPSQFVYMSNPNLPATAANPAGPVTIASFDLVWSKRDWVLADPPADEAVAPSAPSPQPEAPPEPPVVEGTAPDVAPPGELDEEAPPLRSGRAPKRP